MYASRLWTACISSINLTASWWWAFFWNKTETVCEQIYSAVNFGVMCIPGIIIMVVCVCCVYACATLCVLSICMWLRECVCVCFCAVSCCAWACHMHNTYTCIVKHMCECLFSKRSFFLFSSASLTRSHCTVRRPHDRVSVPSNRMCVFVCVQNDRAHIDCYRGPVHHIEAHTGLTWKYM